MPSGASRLERVSQLYFSRDQIADDVVGDRRATAAHWLEEAKADLEAVEPAIERSRFRVAYNAAYDVYRHAAEAVVHVAGFRIRSGPGSHEVTFELAAAVMDGRSDVFESASAAPIRMTRNGLEYLDADRPVEVTAQDARWALQLAERAVSEASTFVAEVSG